MGRKPKSTTMVDVTKQTSTPKSPPQSRKITAGGDLLNRKADLTSKDGGRKETPTLEYPPQSPIVTAGDDLFNGKADPTSRASHYVKKRKNFKSIVATIRRSNRIKKTTANKEIERVIEEIDATESEKDEQVPLDENKFPSDSSDEEKEEGNPANTMYKSMYISSQKKIQDLLKENTELKNNMERVLGKVELIEKQNNVYEEVMTVIASLSKMNENLYSELKERASSPDTTQVEGVHEVRKRSRK